MSLIPKVIHYCWFGGKEKPKLIKKCIKTWKKYLPDYEIIEWNESNFDINSIPFTKEAYKEKKWAFVADYCRSWALYNYGGIYLDTDMEIIKPLDQFLSDEAFAGVEIDGYIGVGIWGCKKNNQFIGELIEYYKKINFCNYKKNLFDIAIPKIITKMAKEKNYKGDRLPEKIGNALVIYPSEYFYPKKHSWENANITENTFAIHHYDGSWKSGNMKFRTNIKKALVNAFGYEKTEKLISIVKEKTK